MDYNIGGIKCAYHIHQQRSPMTSQGDGFYCYSGMLKNKQLAKATRRRNLCALGFGYDIFSYDNGSRQREERDEPSGLDPRGLQPQILRLVFSHCNSCPILYLVSAGISGGVSMD